MATTTTVNNLVINKLTKALYDNIQTKSETELYLVPDIIDSVPTSGSDNYVTSGGVYDALANKIDTLDLPNLETDPTVPNWAKQENKPTYSESELGLESITTVEIDQLFT